MKSHILYPTLITSLLLIAPSLSFGATDEAAAQAACQEHARLSSGSATTAPQASVAAQNPPPQRGAGLRGAARGAARGALLGGTVEAVGNAERYDDAAEIGAAVGAVSGGMRNRRAARQQQPATPAPTTTTNSYTKSYNECMASRGYPVQ